MGLAYDIGFNIIGPLLVGAAGYAIGNIRARQLKKASHEPLATTTRRDVQTHELLAELRILLGASRAYVTRYHNGEKYLDNHEFYKKTRTHEVVAPGISYQSAEYRDIIISSMPEESKLVLDKVNSYRLVSEIPDSRLRRLCETAGVVATVREAIMRGDDIVGFIGADFDDDVKPERLDVLTSYARRIQSILQND